MIDTTQIPVTSIGRGRMHRNLRAAALEASDRQGRHEYVPMDVFVDPRTIKEHFLISTIRGR